MNLAELLNAAGAENSLGQIGDMLGLDNSRTQDVVGALSPALMRGLQKQTESGGGLDALQNALSSGNHQRYIDEPGLMKSEDTRNDGNGILGHLFGSKDVSRNVAAQAAESTGVDASAIRKVLPLVASLAMGALSKQSSSQQSQGGGLGNLISGFLDSDGGDRGGIDGMLSLAKRFF